MRVYVFFNTLLIALLLCLSSTAQSPSPTKLNTNKNEKPVVKTRILFVLDASGSMLAKWQNNTRMNVAKRLLSEIMDSLKLQANTEVALRVYGHRSNRGEQNCKDSHLEVPFYPNNHQLIKEKLKDVQPRGTTPIAYSLQMSGDDFPNDPTSRNILILITDGLESCDGDPCAVSLALQKRHVVLKPFIIGLGLTPEVKNAFDCVGTFYDAEQEDGFRKALRTVIDQAVNKTSFQLSLLDSTGRATETNVPFTMYDKAQGVDRYNLLHTMNSKGVPDTLIIDPVHTYNIVVHTNPPVSGKDIRLNPGQHNTASIKAPMGNLELLLGGVVGLRGLKADIRRAGSCETINYQEINTNLKYIIGNYDIIIPTTPVTRFNNVRISQSKTTRIQLPQPGMLNFTPFTEGYGAIFLVEGNKLTKIHDLNPATRGETVVLQPGQYRLLYRSRNSMSSLFTIEKSFSITSGESVSIKL